MAANIPAALKVADITRFAHRASQLEKFRPVIAYWCEYWIVNQILAKSLHNADGEALEYTTTLMDKLETTKTENANNPAITDDVQGKSACLTFAQETFDRAERAIDANKVTRQTADTFQAAATFFELVNIWGEPDRETTAKIKYAKWNAARIFKAIREGKDPNETNPRRKDKEEEEEEEEPALPALDPDDPEVRMLMGSGASAGASPAAGAPAGVATTARQPFLPPMPVPVTIEDAPNSAGVSPLDAQVSAPSSPLPSALPSAPDQVSPLAPPEQPEPAPSGSYFPSMPAQPTPPPKIAPASSIGSAGSPAADFYRSTPSQPTPPSRFVDTAPSHPVVHHPPPPTSFSPVSPHHPAPPVQQPMSTGHSYSQPPAMHHAPALHNPYQTPPAAAPAPYIPPAQPQQPQAPYYQPHGHRYTTNDVKMAEAQKHARWAISALNFEDVSTAVRELRKALDQLLE